MDPLSPHRNTLPTIALPAIALNDIESLVEEPDLDAASCVPTPATRMDAINTTTFPKKVQRLCSSIVQKKLRAEVKDFQWQSVAAILAGDDVSLVQGTGSGKTWSFYLIQLAHASLYPQSDRKSVLVISPYVALMKFQSESFSKQMVDARIAILGSIDSDGDAIKKVLASNAEFIWTTPEFLSGLWAQPMRYGHLLASLLKQTIAWIFDEVHMVFDVGETYRNCYLSLDSLRRKYERIPVLICSATIPRSRYNELKEFLRMGLGRREDGKSRSLLELVGNVDRPNIYYSVSLKTTDDHDFEYVFDAAKTGYFPTSKFPVVIYWNDKAKLHQLYNKISLLMQGKSTQKVYIYTADICDSQKDGIIAALQQGASAIILATGALGLGVDIPNARQVHHAALPVSFCDLTQELGRAGRDGLAAVHVLRMSPKGLPTRLGKGSISNCLQSIQ
ncbi:P-loop containing nucleoside triphosphate hydrolase protein [Obelidium mucronatum]|nr:P-loop containing nucleoside triphosphate hydrolase protein [Obelidium mucronatum]